ALRGDEDSRRAGLNTAGIASAKLNPFQTRKARDRSIDGGKTLDPALAGKQAGTHPTHRGIATHGDADRAPEVSHQECGQPLRGRCAKPASRLVEVERKVSAFVLDDSFQNCRQQRGRATGAVTREVSAAN